MPNGQEIIKQIIGQAPSLGMGLTSEWTLSNSAHLTLERERDRVPTNNEDYFSDRNCREGCNKQEGYFGRYHKLGGYNKWGNVEKVGEKSQN